MTVFGQQRGDYRIENKRFLRAKADPIVAGYGARLALTHAMHTRQKRADEIIDFRSLLLEERARITGGNHRDLEILVLPGSLAVEDQAPLMHDQFVVLRRHGMDRQKLELIDGGLERLDRGEFGLCAECEEPIPVKRLKVVPWAACCVTCQNLKDTGSNDEAEPALKMIA